MTCSPVFVTPEIRAIAMALAFVLAGCGRLPADHERIDVVATIAPLADWARKVGGTYVNVQEIVPPGIDPRDYLLLPQQREAILAADVVLMNGLDLEPWIEDVLAGAAQDQLIVVEMSQFTGPLAVPRERPVELDQVLPESRSGTGDQVRGAVAVHSPYLWLDVESAQTQVHLIAQAFTRADPDAIVVFQQNAARYSAELVNLDIALSRQIDDWRWRTVLTIDRSLFPLADQQGLSISILGVPQRRNGQPMAQPLFVDAFAASTAPPIDLQGRQVVPINPLGKREYIDLMRTTVQSMTLAMAGR